MELNKTKWATLVIAILFAILQVLQPFIHAHLDDDHQFQKIGFHVAEEHEEVTNVTNHVIDHSLSSIPHAAHTILVSAAIKQDIDSALFIDVIGFVLLILCFAIVIKSAAQYFPQLLLIPPKFSSRRLPASRAPPL